jgi:hypothetical protein
MSRAADAKFSSAMVTVPGVGSVPTGANGGIADASTRLSPTAAQTAAGYGGLALGAASAGYSVGGSLYDKRRGDAGNYARGGLAGAVTGAAIGTMIMPGIGTAVGAIVGLTAGLFGMGAAAKASAAQTREMRAALSATMEGLRASVTKDALGAGLAQIHAESAKVREQIEMAYAGGDKNSANVRERNKLLAEANRLEAERVKQLKEEIATLGQRKIEDFQSRQLRADAKTARNQGRTAEADALDKRADERDFYQQQRREREDLFRSFGTVVDDDEKAQLAAYDAAAASEKQAFETRQNTAALTDNTKALDTAVRNAPSGFKIERYTYANAPAKSVSGLGNIPSPFSPPGMPFNRPAPTIDQTATAALTTAKAQASIGTVNVTLPGVTNAKQFVEELDKIRLQTVGMNGTRSQALERM